MINMKRMLGYITWVQSEGTKINSNRKNVKLYYGRAEGGNKDKEVKMERRECQAILWGAE